MRSMDTIGRISLAMLGAAASLSIGCGAPAIDAMRIKTLTLPSETTFCVRKPRTIPLVAMMDDGARRTIDPQAPREQRFDPGLLEWTTSIGKMQVVRTGALSASPDFAEFVPPAQERDLLEQDVKVTVTIQGNPFLKSELDLKADFSCPVSVDYSGQSGAPGSSGSAGSSGGPGGPGGNASPVEVFLAPFETDKRGTLIQVRVDGANDSASFILTPNGRVAIGARGGDGGPGGAGGEGSRGADKGTGCGDGGAGGPGGSGGAGGPGGQGGPVLVHVDQAHPEWATIVDVDNGPGEGGRGGDGGHGGPGGSPGTQPDGPNQGQTCGSQGPSGASGSSGPSGPGGSAGPPPRVDVGHLTAGSTEAKHAAETAPPPLAADSPEAKAAEAFWAKHKGPHTLHVTNGTSVLICSILGGDGSSSEAPPEKPKPGEKAKPEKPKPGDKGSSSTNLLLAPLKPGESRDLAHLGGSGSLPMSVATCDGKLRGSFSAHLDRDTTVSFQPAGKAPKQGQGAAVYLQPAP